MSFKILLPVKALKELERNKDFQKAWMEFQKAHAEAADSIERENAARDKVVTLMEKFNPKLAESLQKQVDSVVSGIIRGGARLQ